MNLGLSGARLHLLKRLVRGMMLLVGIMTLLTGCTGWWNASTTSITTTKAASATAPKNITAIPLTPGQQAPSLNLVWDSEFNGPAGAPPDASKWAPNVGGHGWGNQQLDYDTDNKNAYQDGQGNLVIEARKGNPDGYKCWYGSCQYTSGQISTGGLFSFTYGRIEARMKIPTGQGLWSAFWLSGDNCRTVGWPKCGEIDVMENIGKEPSTIYGTAHGPGYSSGSYQLQNSTFSDDFHVFALQWDPSHLYFTVDGILYHTVDRASFGNTGGWVYDHPFHIIINLPVGGVWPGTPDGTTVFPQKMYVSYVRVYSYS